MRGGHPHVHALAVAISHAAKIEGPGQSALGAPDRQRVVGESLRPRKREAKARRGADEPTDTQCDDEQQHAKCDAAADQPFHAGVPHRSGPMTTWRWMPCSVLSPTGTPISARIMPT